ncbi:MAG: hypothetical protein GY699_20665 [Desulfobacteraceae bacterium]|nr:hypothetical protein [Desulfobacteraceae bacterium]
MEYEIEQNKDINIAGIKTRTDNIEGITLIPKAWEKFFSGNTLEKIENKVPGQGVYAVYTEYEGDENGKYTFVLGAQTQTREVPGDLSGFVIPAGKYAVFTAQSKEKVIEVWQYIWQNDFERTYISDYEYYDMAIPEVKIYLGVK